MFLQERTPKGIEEAVNASHLMLFDLEDLAREDPNLITETVWEQCYKKDIEIRTMQGVQGFLTAFRMKNGHYSTSIEILQEAERRILEAEEKGYNPDTEVFQTGIDEIFEAVKEDFRGGEALLIYIKDSQLDFEEYKSTIEGNLPRLARSYANLLLKRARRTAKSLKSNIHGGKFLASTVALDLGSAEALAQYGIDESERISQIKQIAYKKGVEFLLEQCEKQRYTPKRLDGVLLRAQKNAAALDIDVFDRIEKVRQLYR